MQIQTNKYGVNTKIKAHILDENKMRQIGFADHNNESLYFCRFIKFPKTKQYSGFDISFNVSINKSNPEDLRIDVLDEDFLQPYDYQRMLKNRPNFEPCLIVKEQVEKHMEFLQGQGVLSGHVGGAYI